MANVDNYQVKERIASGLRAMDISPDFLLYCGDDHEDDINFKDDRICGIPILYSEYIHNTMTDDDVPFMPIWDINVYYGAVRKQFNEGYVNCKDGVKDDSKKIR